MYLISIYFDEQTNKRISQYMKRVAKESGNSYMIDGEVPPHITISAFETRNEKEAIEQLGNVVKRLSSGEIQWVSVGMFLPYVLYLAPVLNEYLHNLSEEVYQELLRIDNIRIRSCYQPFCWVPHTTIGKKLSKEEMLLAIKTMQQEFGVFRGNVTKIGLAKTNPYRDVVTYEL